MPVPPSTVDSRPTDWPLLREADVLSATVPAGRLNPPSAGTELVRSRLHDALTAAVAAAPLTVIAGPAGSGKTVLAAGWARAHAAHRVAWLNVCPIANGSPPAFWAGVSIALRRAGVSLGGLGAPGRQQLPPGFAVRLAARLADLPRPAVLVVDQADALTRSDILEALDLLSGSVGSRLRLVLLARADPLLPLGRERAAGWPAEIHADDLAFRPGEVGALLTRLGAPVSAADAAALAGATDGWAATVPLLAALLCHGVPPDELATAIAADDGSPVQYLLGQVLRRLPGSVRAVLLRAGVAEELWPGLVAPLTGRRDGLRILDWLAGGHTCVERAPGAPGGLRIPSVVREQLAAELAVSDSDGYAAAHRAAADWHAAAERLPQAVARAVAGGDWASTATLLVDDLAVAGLLARGGPPEADLLDAARPRLGGADAALLRAAATLGRSGVADPADLARALAVAATKDAGRGGRVDRPARRASATLLLAAAAVGTGTEPERALVAVDSAQSDAAALVTARPERRAEYTAVLATARASALLATDAGEPVLVEAARAAEEACATAGTDRLGAGRLADLALLQALAGRLREAEALVAEYQALCEDGDIPDPKRSPAAATAAAWVCSERGQGAGVRHWIARARAGAGHRRAAYTTPLLDVLAGRRLRLRGQVDAAGRALAAAPVGLPGWVREQLVGECVRLRLARGDADALRLLDGLPGASPRAAVLRATAVVLGLAPGPAAVPEAAGTGVLPVVALEGRILRAGLLAAGGGTAAAAVDLDEALRAAESERLRRPFLDAPPPVLRLLRTHPGLAAARGWLFTTQQRPRAQPGTRPAQVSGAPLSNREREALALLAAGLSTAGIASAMGTSANTARGHLRSVLRKLSVADRADAVRQAADQGLLDGAP